MLSDSRQIAVFNETYKLHSNNSQLAELKAELDGNKKSNFESIEDADIYDMRSYPRNCAEAKSSGVYEIRIPSYSRHSFRVTCDADTRGGNWTIILQRLDGSENFYRNWNTYKKGFGNLEGEFFLGLDKIHALTADYSQELLVILEDPDGTEAFETYDRFGISDEDEEYALNTLGKASGTAGNSLEYHKTMKFSTYDRDNDNWVAGNCAARSTGAWWYNDCHNCNLAGKYDDKADGKGVNWWPFRSKVTSLKRAIMLIRPRK
ncbi:ficolin-1-like [Drosophila innubila]|uniref:ficolin-1-like n=1 Tax=Drosophila innubila TaxID=198719 RepID=UPI00148D70D6|nr:ficolin-1-like [Drosophila innubila]